MYAQEANFWQQLRKGDEKKVVEAPKELGFKESEYCIENQLNVYLDSLAGQNSKATLIRGYRILIYSGNTREEATHARELAYRSLPRADVYTTYQTPTFKVKLGDFYYRLEALRTLMKIQTVFPSAVIVEEVVNLKP